LTVGSRPTGSTSTADQGMSKPVAIGHFLAHLQLVTMVEEDLERVRNGQEPWIDYIWRGPKEEQDPRLRSNGPRAPSLPPSTWKPR